MNEKLEKKEIEKLKEDALRYIIPHAAKNAELAKGPKIFVKGEGCYVWDIEGRRILDTFATLLVSVCGHNRPEVNKAVQEQMKELEFFPNYVDTFTIPLIKLARKLAQLAPGDLEVSFFVNSGSEACETAIKMAKQYFWGKGERQRYKVVARRNSFHGSTLGSVSASGIHKYRWPFEPLLPGFIHAMSAACYHCELGLQPSSCNLACLREMEQRILWENPETVAAVIMDPIPGSNTGYPIPPDGYLQGVRKLCDKYGIFLIFDEVQTGFGKTGKMFACQHWGIIPDIIALSKGLTGGFLPMGVTITTPRVHEVFKKPGLELRSGSTFGGHTTACAAILANIEIIEKENLVEKAAELGKYIRKRLEGFEKYPIVGDIRGLGLLLAVELVADKKKRTPLDPKLQVGSWIREYCWQRQVIFRNNGDILVIAPPLVMTREQADEMLDKAEEAITEAIKHFKL